jgi:hypothetical protein
MIAAYRFLSGVAIERPLTFNEFRARLKESVESMSATLTDPRAKWPGILFLEVPREGLVVEMVKPVDELDDARIRDLGARVLPMAIRRSKADRFCWLMPSQRHDTEPPTECLVLVLAEAGHREAMIVDVIRGDGPPRLGEWRYPTAKPVGLFADPLCSALLAKRPTWGRAANRRRQRRGEERRVIRPPEIRQPKRRRLRPLCPGCGARVGERHSEGCDVERCSVCFGQRIQCDCKGHDPWTSAWAGEWPGAAECRALGWWAVKVPNLGWRPCPPDTPGAVEDINRLAVYRETGLDCLYNECED